MTRVIDPFTGLDITAKMAAATARLLDMNRRYHAAKDPDCTTWERYSIPGMDPVTRKTVPMPGIGCERHRVFLQES